METLFSVTVPRIKLPSVSDLEQNLKHSRFPRNVYKVNYYISVCD